VAAMIKTYLAVEQIGSPIRRHHKQRETLIGLGLNRIGHVVELRVTVHSISRSRSHRRAVDECAIAEPNGIGLDFRSDHAD
jgi:ribosomal protein L30